jgi:hypothetical protein
LVLSQLYSDQQIVQGGSGSRLWYDGQATALARLFQGGAQAGVLLVVQLQVGVRQGGVF